MLVKYFRKNNGHRKGVFVALPYKDNETECYLIGYSMCHPDDRFDKNTGVNMAERRALTWFIRGKTPEPCPRSMMSEMEKFEARAAKYFKGLHPYTCGIKDWLESSYEEEA